MFFSVSRFCGFASGHRLVRTALLLSTICLHADFAHAVTLGDFNGDGFLDAALMNSDNVSIFIGNDDGTFQNQQTYSTGNGPNSVTIADYNHDGNLDLAVTNLFDSTISILLGKRQWDIPGADYNHLPGWEASGVLAAASLRHNGIVDLIAPDLYSPIIYVYPGNGDGTFGNPVSYNASNSGVQATLVDINHDNNLDLVAAYTLP